MRTWVLLALLFGCGATPQVLPATQSQATAWIGDQHWPIARAWVFSRDNDNLHWTVAAVVAMAFPATFDGDLRQVHVEIAGVRHSVRSLGGDPTATYFEFDAELEAVPNLARGLGVDPAPRTDPGLVLTARLEPIEGSNPPTRGMHLRFVLENHGPASMTFLSGGTQARRVGVPLFEITVEHNGSNLPAPPQPPYLGGLSPIVTLAPGASHAWDVDLAYWARSDEGGLYVVRALLTLESESSGGREHSSYDYAAMRWDVKLGATCEFWDDGDG